MIKLVVVKLLNGSGIHGEVAVFDSYEEAERFIESEMRFYPEGTIVEIRKRWYK